MAVTTFFVKHQTHLQDQLLETFHQVSDPRHGNRYSHTLWPLAHCMPLTCAMCPSHTLYAPHMCCVPLRPCMCASHTCLVPLARRGLHAVGCSLWLSGNYGKHLTLTQTAALQTPLADHVQIVRVNCGLSSCAASRML